MPNVRRHTNIRSHFGTLAQTGYASSDFGFGLTEASISGAEEIPPIREASHEYLDYPKEPAACWDAMFIAKSGAFSADSRLIAFGGGITRPMLTNVPILGAHDSRVFVVRAGEATPWLRLRGHSDYVNAVAFNPQGDLLASGSDYQTVRLWHVE